MAHPDSIFPGSTLRRDDELLFVVEDVAYWCDVRAGLVQDQVKWLGGGGSSPMEFVGYSGHRYVLESPPREPVTTT